MPQHCQPWLADGNVVVASADDTKAFRVHRSVLSTYSEVFSNMFSASHEGEGAIDGCPVVHLQDQADDIEHVLRALYGRGYHHQRGQAMLIPFAVVEAFLRLGKKYQIKELYEEARICLLCDFPDNFASWCSRSRSISFPSQKALFIKVANIAQEVGLQRVLPAALYACMTECSLAEIYNGVQEEGEIASLSSHNRAICVASWQSFQALASKTFSWASPMPSPSNSYCRSKTLCADRKRVVLSNKFYPAFAAQALENFDHDWNQGMCSLCASNNLILHNEGRENAWNKFPALFNLATVWDDLKDDGVVAQAPAA
ncbi:hypothetical protein CONPUDRAFT_166602 [Coniophora puteana RWD-64-598 SS2]|uniref:BTB domain-containing protein n=1 Tax=Coniophora puteana (strain RWD-64-598) TaxID=741705 RepID=A0A5M3ML95_CONPW|nr:uncharacterized protein CONPUDRAFT_166602 [Coniophora puteana RWD-64-598 SS2]EIW79938.1 hypothetical protein CONPUDRAFT_166602 [Coniophora puteana RWD-64-598 SS2]